MNRLFFFLLLAVFVIPVVSAADLKTIYNDTMDSDPGWTGGTYDSTNDWYDTTSSWGTWTGPDLDLANYSFVRWCYEAYILSSQRYIKSYIWETTGTTSDPHVIVDTSFSIKPEPGYSPSYTGSYGGWRSFCIEMNASNEKLEMFYEGSSRWSYTSTSFSNDTGEDYFRIAVGDLNGASEFRVDNVTVQVLCDQYSGGCETTAPDTNFTIYTGSGYINVAGDDDIVFRCTSSQTDCEPENQNAGSSQGIYKVCNNGTASGSSVKMWLAATCTNIAIECDDDYTVAGATTLSTSQQTIHGTLATDACTDISCWADYSNPTAGCLFTVNANVTT